MKSTSASWISALIAVVWIIVPQEALPQNSRVEWWAISSGFGVPGSSTSVVKSSAGQVVVGRAQLSNSLVESGFLSFYGTNAISCALNSGWNLISNPVTNPVPGDSVRQVYPTSANAYAFEFSGGYVQRYILANGKGYWEKFPGAISQSITGTPRTRDSISVVTGWNIVGSISNTVDTSTIVSVPPGLRASQWFGYAGGYIPVTQLIPGKGYWLKSSAAGKFVLANPLVSGPAKAQASGESALDALNTLTITDSRGGSQTLYFGADVNNEFPLEMYAMPPAPPAGALDARFETAEGGSMVQTHAAKVSEPVAFSVAVQSDAYPLTVSWKIKGGTASYELTDGRGGQAFRAKEMTGEGTIKITNSELNKFTVKLVGGGQLPADFALSQNYPNPFNPSTTIKYDLPVDSRVSLKVFNILGQEVVTLVSEEQKAGYRSAQWNANNFASGVYFYTLATNSFVQTKKLVLMK
jgi:hypothetical protein